MSSDFLTEAGQQMAAEYPEDVWEQGAGDWAEGLAYIGALPVGFNTLSAADEIYAAALDTLDTSGYGYAEESRADDERHNR